MTQQTTLHLITYAPALVSKDGRTVDVIHGMEKALPGLQLKWRLSASGRPIPLPQRDVWLLENIEDGEFPIVRVPGDPEHRFRHKVSSDSDAR